MTEILVDSSTLIDFFEGSLSPKAKNWLASYSPCISIVTYFEVCKFFHKIGKTKELSEVKIRLSSFEIKFLSTEICDEAAKISCSHNLCTGDALIYATAKVHSLRLITSDTDLKKMQGAVFVE